MPYSVVKGKISWQLSSKCSLIDPVIFYHVSVISESFFHPQKGKRDNGQGDFNWFENSGLEIAYIISAHIYLTY